MGYAYYETPLGPAGYSVPDVCHHPDCEAKIDRGLAYLCGDNPGRDGQYGCGRWFCGEHLFFTGISESPHACGPCLEELGKNESRR